MQEKKPANSLTHSRIEKFDPERWQTNEEIILLLFFDSLCKFKKKKSRFSMKDCKHFATRNRVV